MLHPFRDIAFDRSKIAIFRYLGFNQVDGGIPLRKILHGGQRMVMVQNGVETLPKIS